MLVACQLAGLSALDLRLWLTSAASAITAYFGKHSSDVILRLVEISLNTNPR
jgi:hypothetical protein